MTKLTKIILAAMLFTAMAGNVLADRGVGKKSKGRVMLNISTPSTIKSSIPYNLKTGLRYTGSLLNRSMTLGNSGTTLITFTKGNMTYVLPYKSRIVVPDVKPGYSGMKLIIRHH